jgi:hypothetical protein
VGWEATAALPPLSNLLISWEMRYIVGTAISV